MAEGLSNSDQALGLICDAMSHAKTIEGWIDQARKLDGLHPWSMPSLANAVGSIQAFQSHLLAAKHHIEKPESPIDASFEIVK